MQFNNIINVTTIILVNLSWKRLQKDILSNATYYCTLIVLKL